MIDIKLICSSQVSFPSDTLFIFIFKGTNQTTYVIILLFDYTIGIMEERLDSIKYAGALQVHKDVINNVRTGY